MRHFVFAGLLLAGLPIFAAEEGEALHLRVQKLELMIEELSAKTNAPENIQKFEILRDTDQLRTQLGPAASKIYFHPESDWQVGLSSELFTYQEAQVDRANVLNVAPVLAFRPHRRVIFNAQFLFENGGSESSNTIAYQKGQSIVQMAYVDWLTSDKAEAGLRIGHQLVPIGWTNTRNEPVTYLSVLKPELERELIPSSWHENGLSLWVDRPRADLQLGIFNSLDARGFRGETFLASGRSQGQNAAATDLMGVFRLNAKNDWFLMGASIAAGNSAQKDPALRNAGFALFEVHGRARWNRLELMGMAARAQLDDSEAISIYNGTTMGASANGNSVQAAFNFLKKDKALWLFVRQSKYNLQASVPQGFTADKTLDKTATTAGLSFFPIPNLVFKGDYAHKQNAAGQKENEVSFGVGVVF